MTGPHLDSPSGPADHPDLIEPPRCGLCALPPAGAADPVIATYLRDVDRTLLRENLKLTPSQRAEKFVAFMRFAAELRRLGPPTGGARP